MTRLFDLPNEIRLLIYQYLFANVRIRHRSLVPKEETGDAHGARLSSQLFAIFEVCRAIAKDSLLHYALRSTASIVFSQPDEYDTLRQSIGAHAFSDIKHLLYSMKACTNCAGCNNDIETFASVLPNIKRTFNGTLYLIRQRFVEVASGVSIEAMDVTKEYAAMRKRTTNVELERAVHGDQLVLDTFKFCLRCIGVLRRMAKKGDHVEFRITICPSTRYLFDGIIPVQLTATMSTKDYIMHLENPTPFQTESQFTKAKYPPGHKTWIYGKRRRLMVVYDRKIHQDYITNFKQHTTIPQIPFHKRHKVVDVAYYHRHRFTKDWYHARSDRHAYDAGENLEEGEDICTESIYYSHFSSPKTLIATITHGLTSSTVKYEPGFYT